MKKAIVFLLLGTISMLGCAQDVSFEPTVPDVPVTTDVETKQQASPAASVASTDEVSQDELVSSTEVQSPVEVALVSLDFISKRKLPSLTKADAIVKASSRANIPVTIRRPAKVDFNDSSNYLNPVQVATTELIDPASKQLDVVVLLDTSLSMRDQKKKNIKQLKLFLNYLYQTDLDWQLSLVTTEADSRFNLPGLNGRLYRWSETGQNYLKRGDYLASQLLWGKAIDDLHMRSCKNRTRGPRNTVGRGRMHLPCIGSTEEPLMVFMNTFTFQYPHNADFFRTGASLRAVVVTDEDESKSKNSLVDPENALAMFYSTFGESKNIKVDAVIIKPNDKSCLLRQWLWGGAYSHTVDKMTQITGGSAFSLCDSDWSKQLSESLVMDTDRFADRSGN